jgi:hypothetical protein
VLTLFYILIAAIVVSGFIAAMFYFIRAGTRAKEQQRVEERGGAEPWAQGDRTTRR